MELTIANIIALFYFGYWIVHNSQPFSIWWLVIMYICLYILNMILISIIKCSSKVMEKAGKDIKEHISSFDKRLKKVEDALQEDGK